MVIAKVIENPCSRENQNADNKEYSLNFSSVEEMEKWEQENCNVAMYRTDGKDNYDVKIVDYKTI